MFKYASDVSLNEDASWHILNEAIVAMGRTKTPVGILRQMAQSLYKLGLQVVVAELNAAQTEFKIKFTLPQINHKAPHSTKKNSSTWRQQAIALASLQLPKTLIRKKAPQVVTFEQQILQNILGPNAQWTPGKASGREASVNEQGVHAAVVAPIYVNIEDANSYLIFAIADNITADDVLIIRPFVDLAVGMLENKLLRHTAKTQQKNNESLRKVSEIVSSTLESDAVLASILEQLATVITYDSAAVMLEYQGYLKLEAGSGFDRNEPVLSINVSVEENPLYQELKQTRRPIIINDVRTDRRYTFWAGTNPIRSWIGVPLILHDEIIGQISIDRCQENAFTKSDGDLVFAFAQHVVTAIQNARLFDEVNRTADELRELLNGSRDVSSSLNTERVVYLMANRLHKLMKATVLVYLLDTDTQALKLAVLLETHLDQLTGVATKLGKHIADQAVTTKQGLIMNHPDPATWQIVGDSRLPVALVAAPFIVQGKAIGAITLIRDDDPVFTQSDLDLLTRFALQTGIAYDNSRLYEALERRLKRENLINKLSHRMNKNLSLARLVQEVMRTAHTISGADLAALILKDPSDTQMYLRYVQDEVRLKIETQSPALPDIAALAIEKHQAILTSDYNQEPYARLKWVDEEITGAIAIPITTGNRVLGALGVFKQQEPFTYSDEILNTLQYIGWQAGVAIENALLFQQVNEYAHTLQEKVEERTGEIKKQKEQTDAILESAADAIFITSAQGVIEYVNPAFTHLTGYAPEEAIGQSFDILSDEKLSKQKFDQVWNTISAGKVWRGDVKNRRKDKSQYDADLTIAPIFHAEGQIDKFVAIQRDISKKTELDRLKAEFLITASHELRTPLTTITGYAELLLNRQYSALETNHFLKYIYEQSNHLSNLVSDLLDVSRIEAGTAFVFAPKLINPSSIFNELVEQWQEVSPNHEVSLRQPKVWPEIKVDPDRLKQVLNNLLSNATKYSPDGGDVTVTVERNLTNLRINVEDQGIGMTLNQQQHLFEKFWRGNAGSVAVEGTGLGMVIVKHIVESHGGKIWVTSQNGEGTTVSFTLPLSDSTATILIVEDDPSILDLEETLLTSAGYYVVTAQSGRRGLELAMSEYPNLIILDLMLPEIEGEDVLHKLKSMPTTQNIPVVVVSAKSALFNIEYAFSLGAADFLTKPFDFDEFLGRIKIALLNQHQPI